MNIKSFESFFMLIIRKTTKFYFMKKESTLQKKASRSLFFIQVFSTLSYSILFSTLVLYITNGLKLTDFKAISITASFVAFNYALHLIGGFVTGRLFTTIPCFFY
ncbi:MAG: hypothetical protein K1060chlam5_01118 [Candidatus Anoxychlamydiales bacterium]|nr:hypothetical protein [Candidatus Anoxychlamydiales bacterium]